MIRQSSFWSFTQGFKSIMFLALILNARYSLFKSSLVIKVEGKDNLFEREFIPILRLFTGAIKVLFARVKGRELKMWKNITISKILTYIHTVLSSRFLLMYSKWHHFPATWPDVGPMTTQFYTTLCHKDVGSTL